VRLGYFRNEHVSGPGGNGRAVFSEKFSLSLDHDKAHFPFDIVRMDGKLLSRLEIEIEDLHIRRFMGEKPCERLFIETVCLIKVDLFHLFLPSTAEIHDPFPAQRLL
jgi:hypothetical protein